MENIFENAYFGKPYKTRDNRKSLFLFRNKISGWYELHVDGEIIAFSYTEDGLTVGNHTDFPEWDEDIVSEWKEETNEEELDKIVKEKYPFEDGTY